MTSETFKQRELYKQAPYTVTIFSHTKQLFILWLPKPHNPFSDSSKLWEEFLTWSCVLLALRLHYAFRSGIVSVQCFSLLTSISFLSLIKLSKLNFWFKCFYWSSRFLIRLYWFQLVKKRLECLYSLFRP